jgi:hypothetical protein
MKKSYRTIAVIITILVVAFNIYDFFKASESAQKNGIKICSEKFRKTNPNVSQEVAERYCSCVLEKLDSKYSDNSNVAAKEIIEKERKTMQECFDNAQNSKK